MLVNPFFIQNPVHRQERRGLDQSLLKDEEKKTGKRALPLEVI
jgi:hypothetical protein